MVAIAVAVVPLTVTAPAAAVPAGAAVGGPAAAVVPCLTDLAARVKSERDVPHWRKHSDTGVVTKADLEALPAQETRPGVVARSVEPLLPDTVVIPVYAHVIKGRHRGEQTRVGPRRLRNLLTILNNGMAARQSSTSTSARYRFRLADVDYRKRDSWYHAFFYGPRDRKMKRALHRGNARTLNLYINGGGPRNQPVLGWARFPWQYASAPRLDGVSVHVASLPGGRATGYNQGDTLIHETGHWLGLFHTFENGCEAPGDLVVDTAPEAEPSFFCQTTRDTCPGDLDRDPVRNFMDYSLDSCMNMFTERQVLRMDAAFERYRL